MFEFIYVILFVLVALLVSCILRKLAIYNEQVEKLEDEILLHDGRLSCVETQNEIITENLAQVNSKRVNAHNLEVKQRADEARVCFAELRKTMSVSQASTEMGISLTTGKRYEKWRVINNQ